MFQVSRGVERQVKWPVVVNVPQDGGSYKKHTFDAKFQIFGQAKIDEILQKFRNDDHDMIVEILAGWENVQDSDGNNLEYSDANKTALIDIPYVRTAIVKAYFECVGGAGAKTKN